MQIVVKKRDGNQLAELNLSNEATTRDLAIALSKRFPKYTPDRSSFSIDKKRLGSQERLADLSSSPNSSKGKLELTFKDLGRQISWKTVFLIEYFGPMVIHPLWYMQTFTKQQKSTLQTVVMLMMFLHFLKRELETLFVHRFSHATMPFKNIFKNSFHYWILSGIWIAYDINSKFFESVQMDAFKWTMVAIWAWAELSNLYTHVILMNLRPPGSKVRKIPYGYGFSSVFNLTCPNYFFETIGWLCVCLMCYQSVGSWVFLVVATGQMYVWALKKQQAYKKEFSNYPRNRRPMFPFV